MEGDPQDQEEDSEAQRRASSPQSSVLWEKCIRQSIFVDLSEDESLHFSDLEGSFTVHLSQADSAGSGNSIHLSENVELSVSDSGESSTESSSCVSGQSERVGEGKTKSSVKRVSAQRPNTEQEQTIWEYENPGDTSDEEQENLPYDGDLGSKYINPTTNHKSEEYCKIAAVLSKEQAGALNSRHNVRDHFDLPAMVGEVNIIQSHMQIEVNTMNHVSITPPEGQGEGAFIDSTKPEAVPTCSSPVHEAPHPDITQLLLRHFSQDELFCSGSLIEAETLPEVSLLESMDETVLSRGPLHSSTGSPNNNNSVAAPRQISAGGPSSESERSQSLQEEDEGKSVQMSPRKNLEETNGKRSGDSPTASEGKNTQSADESYNSDVNSQNSDISNSKQDSNGSDGSDLTKEEDGNDEEEDQICRVPLVRTRSFSELKYGQGQVHYPLPDFSKVAPKVKIPKSTGVPVRPVSQSPIFLRAQSSPGMLGKSSALEVINRVMEDSIQPSERPYMFRDRDKQTGTSPGLVHHLQAEYDKLLTKYAEAENLIDQMRLGTKNQTPSDLTLEFDCGDHQDLLKPGGSHFGSTLFPNAPSPSEQFTADPNQQNRSKQPSTSPTQTEQQSQSEGERMTRELRDIISQFLQKVDEFKLCLTTMSITIEEQEMVFKSMMDSQDQLERRYISKKEEHRTLEMQNYLGLARNTGQFDPERQVEGEIFRIGMHLEDIKELIDRNVCEQQVSPPHSSSTLLSLCGGPSLPGLLTSSLSPPLHEGLTLQVPGPCFSTGGYETVEREDEEYEEVASEVHGHDGLYQSCDLTPADSLLNSAGNSSVSLRLSQGSLDISNTGEEEEEEEEERGSTSSGLSEGIAHDRVLEYLALQNPGLRDRLWTPESLQQRPLSPDCDLGGSVSLAVEVSCSSDLKTQSQSITDHTLTTSQRIVSPETDSGFGSSDLSLPATGLSQPKLHTDRLQFQPDGNSSPISMSDSEGSCSNLQTTMHQPAQMGEKRPNFQINVHSAGLTEKMTSSLQSTVHLTGDIGERRPSLQSPVQLQLCRTAVDHWVTSTTPSVPAGLHEGESHTPSHHDPERQLETSHSIAMDMPQRDCHSHTCSCHSEAIQALQLEVSQLKRDLEEGLAQLPHLSQRMDYLTSRCKQNRDRRPKTRPRTHHKPAGSRQSLTNTNSKIEDWISSDMDPSKSKGTDSVKSDQSGIIQPFHSTPLGVRRGSIKPYSCSDGPGKPQSKKHLNTASEENRSLETSNLTHPSPLALWHSDKNSSYRSPPPPGDMENVYSKGRYTLSSQLLQVNYSSSCSLPAGFKVREQQSVSHHRRRSTQSDSALLPSNVYFQRTFPPALSTPRTWGRASRHKASKDEDINRTLDRAIEAARSMKRTTDRMAKSLSADLSKVELYRKLHSLHPLTGRNNTGS